MRYKTLGGTGLLVSEICLGTMTFGGGGFWTAIGTLDQSVADRVVGRALEAGVNFIDTADVYSDGLSEEITGRAIANSGRKRSDVVVATKAVGAMGKGPNDRGASRGHLMDAAKASLKRLGTDYIDLYQIHSFDRVTPIEETVRALDDLVRQGYVRYVGLSNWQAWTIMKALGIAERHGLARAATLQAYYTIAGRDLERELAPLVEAEKLGLMVWSSARRRTALGKIRPRQQRSARLAPGIVRFSAGRSGARVCLRGRDARGREATQRVGGAHCAGLVAAPAVRDVGHRRRYLHRAARG